MATQKCRDNIASEQPPYNVPCTSSFCYKTSFARGVHCSDRGLPLDTPVLSWDPDLNGGQACYCCCSCFTLDTPIEETPGHFTMIQDIKDGQQILAAGVDLQWRPTEVKFRTGDTEPSVVPGLYYVEYVMPTEDVHRHLLVTPDHLFLMHGTRTLKKVQHLIPGDELMTADGGVAEVQFATPGEHNTSIQSIEMAGSFDPETLDGHLLNSNGVVTADYAVQSAYELGDQTRAVLAFEDKEDVLEAGTDEYQKRHGSRALQDFADDPSRWPRGFVPLQSTPMTLPPFARGYLSPPQAEAVETNAEFNAISNMAGRAELLYLFERSRQMFPDIVCILDWANRTPNAYAWQNSGQKFILVAGGLVRLKGMYLDGLSVILASLQASLQKQACVCEWDYAATYDILRDTWPDSILASLVPQGIAQVEAYFSYTGEAADPGGDDPCNQPKLSCRIESYWAGMSFFNIPECAGVRPRYLEVEAAYASIDNDAITVTFNVPPDSETATDVANYTLTPAATIYSATINPDAARQVLLKVEALTPDSYYVLLLKNILSSHGAPLGPDQGSLIVRTN